MDKHTADVLLDATYLLAVLFVLAVAVTRIMLERIAHRSSKLSLGAAIYFALNLILNVYQLFNDMSSSSGVNTPIRGGQVTAFAYLFGQLVPLLIFGAYFAVDDIRQLLSLRAARQRLLKQLEIQSLALQHPEAAAAVEALTNVLEKQSRAGLLQSIWLGAIFYVLGVITPYVIGAMSR